MNSQVAVHLLAAGLGMRNVECLDQVAAPVKTDDSTAISTRILASFYHN